MLAFCVLQTGVSSAQDADTRPNMCFVQNDITKKSLDKDNTLFWAIAAKEVGEGVDFPWTSSMRDFGVKHAVGVVQFRYNKGTLSLILSAVNLYRKYYDFLDSKQSLKPYQLDALEKDLKVPFYFEATKLLRGIKIQGGNCGTLYVNILDRGCLPVRNEIPEITSCERL